MLRRQSFALLVPIVLAACTAGGGAVERLDTRTGLTWRSLAEPSVYARQEPRYSRAGRDYLYLGPVETNARGLHEYFVWVGVATTLDRGFLAPSKPPPTHVTFVVGGEPVDIPLVAWIDAAGAALAPYEAPVPLQTELGGRLTGQLLSRIGRDGIDAVEVGYADGRFENFFRWTNAAPAWAGFFGDDDAR